MHKRLFIITAVFIFLCGVASAQDYNIRVSNNTNLRSSASLQAGIVEAVPAGTTLTVVGQFNRWLEISRDGNVWMADWVAYERVGESAGEAAPQPADEVDNCCFVDRQCASDQEWTDGYWAFQNRQCEASDQTQVTTTTQAETAVSADVNNCCFVDRQCASDQEWTDGYWAFQNGQCGPLSQAQRDRAQTNTCCQLGWNCTFDFDQIVGREWYAVTGGHCPMPIQENIEGVILEGTAPFLARVHEAFALLQSRAPEWYAYIIAGPRKIRENSGLGDSGGSHALWDSINIHPYHRRQVLEEMARVLVHETCHVHRIRDGLFRYDNDQEVRLEENLCELAVDDMRLRINPNRPHNPWLEDAVTLLLSEGIDVFAPARAEIDRAHHLLASRS